MLKRKALNKIFITSFTIFIIFTIYLIPNKIKRDEVLDIDIKTIYTETDYCKIYLLNTNNQLVRTDILVKKNNNIAEAIKEVLEKLMVSNRDLIPGGLYPIIPKNTKIINLTISEDIASITFSKEIINVSIEHQEKLIEAISYTIFEFKDIKGVSIFVEDKNIREIFKISIPDIITRDYGINKRYVLKKIEPVQKVVIYYIDEIDNNKYYVPITKYVNNEKDKIKIIVEELSGNYIYEPNLISYLNKSTLLTNYEIDNNKMILNFNNSIFMGGDSILEEVVYTISYSVFDTYDVDEIIFQVDGSNFVKKVLKNVE